MTGQAQLDVDRLDAEGAEPILFPEGLLGFPDTKHYELVDLPSVRPFKWLRAAEGGPCFVVIDPREFVPQYSIPLPSSDVDALGLAQPAEAEIYVLVVVPEDPALMSANLKGPLVINRRKGLGKQVVLLSSAFSTRHFILEEMWRGKGQSAGK